MVPLCTTGSLYITVYIVWEGYSKEFLVPYIQYVQRPHWKIDTHEHDGDSRSEIGCEENQI